MANKDKKNVKRFVENVSKEVATESYEGGGGTIVVTELPEVGDEHTIYELHETKIPQSLVPMFNEQMRDDHVLGDVDYTFVFNTTKEMQDTFNSIVPVEESGDIYLNYITEEDKLIGAVYENNAWKFTEALKISSCKFDVSSIFEVEDTVYEVILKEYLGDFTGKLWNDELYTFERDTIGILLGTPTIGGMYICNCEEELHEIPEEAPKEIIFETIPYKKIINGQLFEGTQWIFTPKSEGVTEISYWIYSNDTWINIDEIGTHNTITIPIWSIDSNAGLIPLSKVHFYLDDEELNLVAISGDQYNDYGYLVVPLSSNPNVSYQLHIVFDNDVIIGGDSVLANIPTFVSVEEDPRITLLYDTKEYDFEIYVGDLVLNNGNQK